MLVIGISSCESSLERSLAAASNPCDPSCDPLTWCGVATTLCAHSCAPRKNFPVGHPSQNCSRPSTLNLGVLWRSASGKKLQLVGMSILLILLSSRSGCHILTPLRDRRPRRSIPSQKRPLLATSRTSSASSPCATSVRPVPTVHVPRPCIQCHGASQMPAH